MTRTKMMMAFILVIFTFGQQSEATHFVEPKVLLLEAGKDGVVTFKFNNSFSDYDCTFHCNGKELLHNAIEKWPSNAWHNCQYKFEGGIMMKNCNAAVTGLNGNEEINFSEEFHIPEAIRVNNLSVVALEAIDADFGNVHLKYPNPLECKFHLPNGSRRFMQENCRMTIQNTELTDAGVLNFNICLKATPDACVKSHKSVYVLSANKDGENLTITVIGPSPMGNLSMKCSDGCSNSDIFILRDNGGLFKATWENVTDCPVIQIYQGGSIIFNRTVTGSLILNPKPEKQTGAIVIGAVTGVVMVVISIIVLLVIWKKKLLCFKPPTNMKDEIDIPLNEPQRNGGDADL